MILRIVRGRVRPAMLDEVMGVYRRDYVPIAERTSGLERYAVATRPSDDGYALAAMTVWTTVEAALRVRLDSEQQLVKLIGRAQQERLITDKWATQLQAARHLRNDLAHARQQDAWTVGMAAPVLATAHEVIAVLYPD